MPYITGWRLSSACSHLGLLGRLLTVKHADFIHRRILVYRKIGHIKLQGSMICCVCGVSAKPCVELGTILDVVYHAELYILYTLCQDVQSGAVFC